MIEYPLFEEGRKEIINEERPNINTQSFTHSNSPNNQSENSDPLTRTTETVKEVGKNIWTGMSNLFQKAKTSFNEGPNKDNQIVNKLTDFKNSATNNLSYAGVG